MKLHLPKLLLVAVLSCTMAQAKVAELTRDGVTYKYLFVTNGDETFDGDLNINHLHMGQGKRTVTVNGDTVINSNLPKSYDIGNPTHLGNACQLQMNTTFVSDSITFNCQTTGFAKTFSIYGNVKTDSFIVNATEAYPAKISIMSGGVLETRTEGKTGTFTIGENTTVNVGSSTEGTQGTIKGFKTEIDGGTLIVGKYAAMDDITLINGSVEIKTVDDEDKGRVLGDITVKGGTISLNNANISSDITMSSGEGGTSGILNILGDVKTGALTLNSGTIYVGSEHEKATLSTTGDLLVDGATLNLINGALKAVSMNSGSIVVSTGSTIESLTLSGGSLSGDLSGCKMTTAADDEESVKVSVDVANGDITVVEGTELSGTISEGELTTQADSLVSADIVNTEIIAKGGEISGTISGTSSVTVNSGTTTLTGTNTYEEDTTVNGGTLEVGSDKALGESKVSLESGSLNLGSFEVDNDIEATGGTLSGAENYDGNLVVKEDLTIVGDVTANSITLLDNGSITMQAATTTFSLRATTGGAVARTDAMVVRTKGDGAFTGNLTLNEDGLIELNNGNSLAVTGALTLGNGTKIVLIGDYVAGDTLVSATESLTQLGEVTLVYDNEAVVMKLLGNSLVLVGNFIQDKADAVAQGNWGIASASRAFVNTVRGQHSHTGCIANGRGTVWAAAFGAYNDMDGADINVKGAAVGVDTKVGSCSTVGLAVGYADGEVSPTGLRDVDQEGTYVALYGEHGLKKLSSTSCLSLDWVAAYGNTESEWNGMDWEQDSLQLNTRLNWNKKVTDRLCMSVFGGLEYFASESDTVNGVKTGSIQNLRGEIGVGARYVAWGAPGAAASYDEKGAMVAAAQPGCEKLVFNGEIRYMNDLVRSNPVIRMNGLSGDGENPGRQGLGIEAGATYRIGERWSASANYGFNAMEDSKEHRVNVGASYTF